MINHKKGDLNKFLSGSYRKQQELTERMKQMLVGRTAKNETVDQESPYSPLPEKLAMLYPVM